MTKKKANKDALPNQSIVALGLDEDGKPRAARFMWSQKDLVIKAAGLMKLDAFEVDNATHAEHLSKLPIGRLYSNGRGFVPYVRRDRFVKLRHALGLPAEPQEGESPGEIRKYPHSWDVLEPGDLVIAQEQYASDGWWEAVVREVKDDMLTLQWRDYPKQPLITRHRTAVALLNPPGKDLSADTPSE
jgi:hypothetical protein